MPHSALKMMMLARCSVQLEKPPARAFPLLQGNRTHALIAAGLAVLVASTLIVGYGNYIKTSPGTL